MTINLDQSGIVPWLILAVIALMQLAGMVGAAIADRYDIAVSVPGGVRVTRRWYGTRAHVRNRDSSRPEIYAVLAWDDEQTDVPWLLLEPLGEEDGERFWAPVTAYASDTVRRLAPHMTRVGRLRIPALFGYRPLPGPAAIWRDGT